MEFYNDIVQFSYFISVFISLSVIYLLSILAHELGHIIAFRVFGKKIKLRFHKGKFLAGLPRDYFNLTEKQYFLITYTGILSGLFMLAILLMFMFNSDIVAGGMVILYFWGCRNDIKEVLRIIRGQKK